MFLISISEKNLKNVGVRFDTNY